MANIEQKFGIEFDGPYHYLIGDGNKENGRTKLKRRILDKLGWTVVHIDYKDWDEIKSKYKDKDKEQILEKKKNFLRDKIIELEEMKKLKEMKKLEDMNQWQIFFDKN